MLPAELVVFLIDPLGGILEGRDSHESLRLRRLSLVDEDREGIVYGVGADEQVSPVLAHDVALRSRILRPPLCQELSHTHLVGSLGGILRYGVVPADGELAKDTVGIVLNDLALEEGPHDLEGVQAGVVVISVIVSS